MLKKCTSWLLLVSLLSACFLIFPVSAVPADDAEAAAQGYHAKYETADGTVKYFAFEALSPTNRNSLPADVPAGGTVTLIADVTIGFELILDRDLTLDGNGHTLDGAFRTADAVTGADVTVKNLNVVLDLTERTSNAYLYQIKAGNACTFENCTFTVNGNPAYGLIILRGNLTMRDCTFTWTADGNKPVFFDDANGQAVLEGTEFDLSGAPDATLGISTGYVAEVNGQGYNSFSSAMAAAAAGDTVTLLDNIPVSSTQYITKSVTLDGNGKTISGNTDTYLVRVDDNVKDVVITGLTIRQNGGEAALQINAGGSLTLRDSLIHTPITTTYGAVIVNGALVLDSGAQVLAEGSAVNGTQSVGVRMNNANATLTVNEGAVITTTGNTFKANGANQSVITINGGAITTSRRMWEAAEDNRCTLVINGGTFVSKHDSEALICVFGSKDQTIRLLGGSFTAPKIIDTENALTQLGGTITFNGQVIFTEPVEGDLENPTVDIRLPGGNAATLGNSGIRFETRIDKELLDALEAAGATVATGTLIAAKASVDAAGAFTTEALEAAGKNWLIVENEGWYNADTAAEDGYYRFFGSMVNLTDASLTGELAGIGYMTVTIEGLGSFTYYGNELSGVVRDLAAGMTAQDDAQAAILDFFRGSAD